MEYTVILQILTKTIVMKNHLPRKLIPYISVCVSDILW